MPGGDAGKDVGSIGYRRSWVLHFKYSADQFLESRGCKSKTILKANPKIRKVYSVL
jgi:hypothetical protein